MPFVFFVGKNATKPSNLLMLAYSDFSNNYSSSKPNHRSMHFHSLILKNLLRRRFRSLLTLVAFSTAIFAVVSLLGIAQGFQTSFAQVYRSHRVDIVVSRQGVTDRLSSALDAALADRISDVEGVDRTAAVLLETLSLESKQVYGIPSMGIAADSWMLADFEIKTSRSVELMSLPPKSILLGQNLAQRVGLNPDDIVELFDERFTIAGIYTSKSTWENGSMILRLEDLQTLTGREGQVTYVNVVTKPESPDVGVAEIVKRIQQLDAKLLAMLTEDFVATDTRMQIASAMAWMTSVVAILIGAIGTLNTMMTSVIERTGEIGILRAVGWSRFRIVAMIVGESTVLAIIGTISGCSLAVVLTFLLSRSSAVAGILAPSIDPVVLAKGTLIGLLIGLLGALLPALRAAKLLPTDAFRDLS